jgi:cobalt-zinc-cadmium efflux system outer membrane protein
MFFSPALLMALAVSATAQESHNFQLTPGTPAAQSAPASSTAPRVLTLDDALRLAEEHNPMLHRAVAEQAGARAAVDTAKAYPNPQFNTLMGHQYGRRDIATPGVPGLLQHYSFSQPIETPGVRRTRIEAANRNRESSRFGLAAIHLSVRAAVKRAFYDVLRRKEEIQHAAENLKLVQDLERRTEVQVNVGEAAKLELTRAQAERATAQNVVKSASILYIGALSGLRAAIGVPLDENVEIKGSLDPPVTLLPLAALHKQVLAQHPAMAQARAQIETAQAVLANERALRMPQPSLAAEYERQPDLGFYRIGISIPVPAWDRRKGPIAEAQAALEQATAAAKEREVEITAALERAYGQYEVANQQVASFEAGALRQATAAVEAAQAAYKFGERGIIEVLDAQRVLQRVRGDFLDARIERESALIDLEELGAVKAGGNKQ